MVLHMMEVMNSNHATLMNQHALSSSSGGAGVPYSKLPTKSNQYLHSKYGFVFLICSSLPSLFSKVFVYLFFIVNSTNSDVIISDVCRF
ncbi:hypothetical protein HanRHA438_Chr17g0823691 [Helianthus annuus]|nr:hypothetical protein HanRHA438_Chr17g0823691 [Helianthus annuus]